MESADQQWQQLKENYEHMTEGELWAVAGEADELTEIAREALQAVIREKGLAIRLKLEPSAPTPGEPLYEGDLVVFSRPQGTETARQTMRILAAAGIPSFLCLEVRAEDVQRAREALDRDFDEEDDDPEEKKQFAILCPKCRSAKVVLEGGRPELQTADFTEKFQWHCDACGHQWMDDGIVQEVAGGQTLHDEEEDSGI